MFVIISKNKYVESIEYDEKNDIKAIKYTDESTDALKIGLNEFQSYKELLSDYIGLSNFLILPNRNV